MKIKRENKFNSLEDRHRAIHDALMVRRSHLDTPMSAQIAQEFNHEHIRQMEKLRSAALRDLTRQIEEERIVARMTEALTPPPKALGHDDMPDALRYGVGISRMSFGHNVLRNESFGSISTYAV